MRCVSGSECDPCVCVCPLSPSRPGRSVEAERRAGRSAGGEAKAGEEEERGGHGLALPEQEPGTGAA